jgi:hypothetical protein
MRMQKQTVEFAIEQKQGVVTRIGKSVITMPKVADDSVRSARKPMKWYKDKRKAGCIAWVSAQYIWFGNQKINEKVNYEI